MIALNYRDAKPIYQQIMEGFVGQILSGLLSADEKLPSVRELATQLTINPNTIQRAYRELEAQGFTYSVAGKGSFVAPKSQVTQQYRQEQGEKLGHTIAQMHALGMTQEEILDLVHSYLKEEFEP